LSTSRRRFLQLGAAVTVFQPNLRGALARRAPGDFDATGFDAAVVEGGSVPCLRFGEQCRRLGVDVHEIRDDVTALWFRTLDKLWRDHPAAVAGMTRWPALFCLAELARQYGLRVVHHEIHRSNEGMDVSREMVVSHAPYSPRREDDDVTTLHAWVIAQPAGFR